MPAVGAPKEGYPMWHFLLDVLASFVAGLLVAVVVHKLNLK